MGRRDRDIPSLLGTSPGCLESSGLVSPLGAALGVLPFPGCPVSILGPLHSPASAVPHTWYLEGGGQRGHQLGPRVTPLPGVTEWVFHTRSRLRNGPSTSGVLGPSLPAPQLTKPLPGDAVAKTVSTPSHGATSGQDIPVPTTVSPKTGGNAKSSIILWENKFLLALRCHEGGSSRWEQQPRGKLLPFTGSPVLAGRFGDQNPPRNCIMQPPQLHCWNWSSTCSRLHFWGSPCSPTAPGTRTWVPVTAGAGTGAATKGSGRWHSSGSGQLLMWVSSCLPAAHPTVPLDVLCHL